MAAFGLTQLHKQQFQLAVNPSWHYSLTEGVCLDLGMCDRQLFYADAASTPLFDCRLGSLTLGGAFG